MVDQIFFDNFGPFSLKEVAKLSNSTLYLHGKQTLNEDLSIIDIAPMDLASEGTLTFFNNKKYLSILSSCKASACFISEKYVNNAPANMALLISDNPYKAYALTAQAFYPEEKKKVFTAREANINSSCVVGNNTIIEPTACIASNVIIGENCYIGAGAVILDNVIIGDNCRISACVSISHTIVGDNTIIHPGARIGQDGFGFASDARGHYKIPQLGRVLIGRNVEIGANSCIDRGSGHDTIIGDGCMIDNLVQIGHNVELGKNCVVVSQVGISGSTKIGDFVVIGGQAGIAGHLKISSGSRIAAQSGVIKNIDKMEEQGGYPAIPIREWHRQTIILKNLTKRGNKKHD